MITLEWVVNNENSMFKEGWKETFFHGLLRKGYLKDQVLFFGISISEDRTATLGGLYNLITPVWENLGALKKSEFELIRILKAPKLKLTILPRFSLLPIYFPSNMSFQVSLKYVFASKWIVLNNSSANKSAQICMFPFTDRISQFYKICM